MHTSDTEHMTNIYGITARVVWKHTQVIRDRHEYGTHINTGYNYNKYVMHKPVVGGLPNREVRDTYTKNTAYLCT